MLQVKHHPGDPHQHGNAAGDGSDASDCLSQHLSHAHLFHRPDPFSCLPYGRRLNACAVSTYRIRRDDGLSDSIAGRRYATYDEAHAELERYYADLCCSDEREYYRIEEEPV